MDSQDIFDERKLRPGANDFDPAADLDDLMAQAGQNPAYRPEFLRRLLLSTLLVMVAEEPDADDAPDEYVGFSPLQLNDGKVPVFTSMARLQDNPALLNYKRVSVKGRDLLEALQGRDICLNPFSDTNMVLPAAICQRILAGTGLGQPEMLPTEEEEQEVLIGQPAEYPTAAVEAIQLLLSGQPRVRAAYLVYLLASGAKPAYFVIGLDVEGDFKGIAQEVILVAKSFTAELGNSFVVQPVEPGTDAFMDYVLSTTPFYARD